ncbi:MAG: alginate lyase family protein [Acidobacteria bacterium]|nr:alginate lyase family protein [Acidobacteriota bacterium]
MPTLFYYLLRFKELGIRAGTQQAYDVLARQASSLFEGIRDRYVHSDLNPVELLQRCGFSSTDAFLLHFKTRPTPAFFFDDDIDSRLEEFRSLFPDQAERIIRKAELSIEHKFDLLGSGCVDLDAVSRKRGAEGYLPWHVDFKSGASWNRRTHSKRIRYGDRPGVDVKVPWELSRFQHLIAMGQAYHLQKDERFSREFVRQVEDWIESNPCRYGVNWSCTMEVGIRAVNWIWAYYLFRNSAAVDGKFLLKLLTSLHAHARFIRGHLEYREAWVQGRKRRLNSNHYLSDLAGLLFIAVLFPELRLAGDGQFAAAELETELFEETTPDGVDYEHSTFYHRFALEIFLSGFLLLRLNGIPMKPESARRLERMTEFVAAYLRPDGSAPQIGDSDNGRLHPLSIRDYADHRYLPLMAAELFGREDLRVWERDPEVWWWAGAVGRKIQVRPVISGFPNEERSERKTRNNRSDLDFPDLKAAGFYILRGSHSHVFVSAATVGMCGLGSHSHNDILSFEYWSKGKVWIVDPGTYVYTPDPQARNMFRSTKYHNTVQIDGEEINRFQPDQLFRMADEAQVTIHESKSDFLDAAHTGYTRLTEGILHRRRFQLLNDSGALTLLDSFEGSGAHRFEWFFHLHPDVGAVYKGAHFLLESVGQRIRLTFASPRAPFEHEIQEGWYSPSYGIRERAWVIVVRITATAPVAAETTIEPC